MLEQVTLTGNLPYTLPVGLAPNIVHRVAFTQDATGGHTVTFAGQPVVVDLAAGASSTVEFHPVRGGYVALAAPLSSTYGRGVNAADPQFGGLVSDGDLDTRLGTDNSATLRAAIAAAKAAGSAVYIPAGTYSVTQTIPLPSGVTIYGDGPSLCRIVSPTPGMPVIASEGWLTEFGTTPAGYAVVDGIFVAAEASDPESHGILLHDWRSTIKNCKAWRCGGDGFRYDSANQAGVEINTTYPGSSFVDLFAEQNRGWGFRQKSSAGTQLTDVYMTNVRIRGVAQAANPEAAESIGGLYIGRSAGWNVSNIHVYGRFRTDAVVFGACWGGSILNGAHIEQGWENCGLRMPLVGRAGLIDNITIAMSEYGKRVMLEAEKNLSAYPGEALAIGTLQLISNFATTGTGVTWSTQSADLRISNLVLSGANVGGISLLGGHGAGNIVTAANMRVISPVRESIGSRTLTVSGIPLSVGDTASWNGNGALALDLKLPSMSKGTVRQFMLVVGSGKNVTQGRRSSYVGMVMVGLNSSGVCVAYLVDVVAPFGFAVAPSVAVTTAPTSTTSGVLTVSFTATDSDGYGAASIMGVQV